MIFKKNILISLFAVMLSAGLALAADEPLASAPANGANEANTARQLRIYKTALLNGPTEKIRSDAAAELLYRQDSESRDILLQALALKDNSPARQAVCRAIIDSRSSIINKEVFLEPLLAILQEAAGKDAKYAAEATLIFEYAEIASELTKNVNSGKNNRSVRLNALYALSLRPVEKQAVATIVKLFDDADKQIARAAEDTLPYWIPAGMDGPAILRYLRHKSQSEIIRDWVDFQEKEVRRLQTERQRWQRLYLSTLNKQYETADDTSKGIILLGNLGSDLVEVRLWGLEKAGQLSPSIILPPEFDNALLALVSDPDRLVRLKTAEILSNMSDRNPAEKLLAQFKVEEYDNVKLEIFKSLSEACYYAFSPGSTIELSENMRTVTLIIAEQYLGEKDAEKATVGAEAILKLLESNGFNDELVEKYLRLLSARFTQAQSDGNNDLSAEILNVMARLCGQSTHNDLTARLFGVYLLNSLDEKDNEQIRRIAVTGLVNIDKTEAMETFKERLLMDDPSLNIRLAVIELAGETGKAEDITWLMEKLTLADERSGAWEAIKQILQRQQADVIDLWASKLAAANAGGDRVRTLLVMAEKKAETENNTALLKSIRKKLQPMLLEVYLKSGDVSKVSKLIASRLKESDAGAEDALAKKITAYLDSGATLEQKRLLVKTLSSIREKTANGNSRPQWKELVKIWQQKIAIPVEPSATPESDK